MLLEVIKDKINSLKEKKNELQISSEDRQEIERKVNEYRQSLLDSLQESLTRQEEIIEGQLNVLEELVLTEEAEQPMEDSVIIPYEREES